MSDYEGLGTLERHAVRYGEHSRELESKPEEMWDSVVAVQISDPDIEREDAENWAFWLQAWGEE